MNRSSSAEGPATPLLEFRGVHKHFDTPSTRVRVLAGIDLELWRGDFIGITGPSGSGKSTLLNLAALLDTPSDGSLRFEGTALEGASDASLCDIRRNGIGMVFQKYCLLPHRSTLENVLFRFRYVRHQRDAAVARAIEVLDMVGLSGLVDRPARLLSGGEMQRVAIARAVVLRPLLLVADEPTGNLDRITAHAVMDCFRALNEDGLSLLLVTHNESLLAWCTRKMRCVDGRLEAVSR